MAGENSKEGVGKDSGMGREREWVPRVLACWPCGIRIRAFVTCVVVYRYKRARQAGSTWFRMFIHRVSPSSRGHDLRK
jgi:hypothetical protein